MSKDIRSFIIGILSNITIMFIVFIIPVSAGFLLTSSLETRMAFVNTGFILFLIFVIFYFHFIFLAPMLSELKK